jgi:hypothetical protein
MEYYKTVPIGINGRFVCPPLRSYQDKLLLHDDLSQSFMFIRRKVASHYAENIELSGSEGEV